MDNENSNTNIPNESSVRYYQSDNPSVNQPAGVAGAGMAGAGAAGMTGTMGHAYTVPQKKRRPVLKALLICAIVFCSVIFLSVACSSMFAGGEQTVHLPSAPFIAVLYVEGGISRSNVDSWGIPFGYQHRWTLDQIDRLIENNNNVALILRIDSPGGSVYAIDELYLKIREFQTETGRPVYVSMSSMAASGGYYIAAPADRIYANRNGLTGSIGVTMGTIIDLSEFLDSHGIRTATIASGEHKSMGSMFDPFTEEQADILQSIVDEAFYQFVEIIMEGRGMDFESVMAFADGRILTAAQALEFGMIDAIGTYADALQSLQSTHNLHDAQVVSVRHTYISLLSGLVGRINFNINAGITGDVAAMLDFAERQNQFPLSYLCPILANR